jgi:hypothetical protein
LLAVLTVTTCYQAQTGFYKSYDVKTQSDFSNPSDITLTHDSCYVTTCTSYDSSLASSTIELFKIDPAGNMLWRQTFFCPNTPYSIHIVQSADSGFFISSSYDYPMDTTTKVLLIRTDKNGNQQWVKLLGDNTLGQGNYDLQISGDNVFILSQGYIKLGGGQYQNGYFITKTDLTGNILWYKFYNWSGTAFPRTFAVTQKKEIFVSGEISSYGYSYLALSKIDSNGTIKWSKIYTPTNDIQPLNMIVDSSNNIILTGHMWASPQHLWDIFLMKIDSSGTFKWAKSYGGLSFDEGWAVFQSQSGYVICAEPESFTGYSSRASLIKTDSSGNMQWMKIYGDTTGSFPNGALQLKNGFIIYGINGSYSFNSSTYLLKTDLNGITSCKWYPVTLPDSSFFLTPIDSGYTATVQGVMTYTLTQMSRAINKYDNCELSSVNDNPAIETCHLFPNPNSGYFTVRVLNDLLNGELIIFNSLGQRFYSQEIERGDNDIKVTKVPCGLYIYTILSNDQVISRGKLVIE